MVRLPATLLALTALIAGCGGDGDGKNDSTTSSGAECQEADQPPPKNVKLKAPTKPLKSGKTYKATVETSCGTFVITLDTKDAPKTSASFVHLADEGFYDDLSFTRVAPGFVIQGGSPNQDQSGGPGYSVRETPSKDLVYSQGDVAMAKTGAEPAGTSGSQFFVMTADSDLPPDFALLGKVTKGLDVVTEIEAQGTPGGDGPPSQPIVIERISISD